MPTAYLSFSAEINQQTAETFLGACAKLCNDGADEIYVLLSSPGGSVMNGLNVYNVLRGLPCTITMHNVGNVDSIGNMIFLAGKKRLACPQATFMFHGVCFEAPQGIQFDEKLLRERLDSVLADQERIGSVIVERTNLTQEEVKGLFFEAVTRDSQYALEQGIVHEIRDVQVPKGQPIHQLVFQR